MRMRVPMYKLIALPVAAVVCGAAALYATRSPETASAEVQPPATAQVEAASSIPDATAVPAAASSCKDMLTIKFSTSADPKDAGRQAIGKWHNRAVKLYGAEFANFKAAEEPAVRCQKQGKGPSLNCVAEARPCAK